MENRIETAPNLKISVPWKNAVLTLAISGFLLIDLSAFSVKNIHAIQYAALSVGLVVLVIYTIRAARVAIMLHDQQIELRSVSRTKRFAVSDVKSVEVGSEVTPITRYYLVFALKDGRVIKMKDVFLWGVTKNARLRAEEWTRTVRERIEA